MQSARALWLWERWLVHVDQYWSRGHIWLVSWQCWNTFKVYWTSHWSHNRFVKTCQATSIQLYFSIVDTDKLACQHHHHHYHHCRLHHHHRRCRCCCRRHHHHHHHHHQPFVRHDNRFSTAPPQGAKGPVPSCRFHSRSDVWAPVFSVLTFSKGLFTWRWGDPARRVTRLPGSKNSLRLHAVLSPRGPG